MNREFVLDILREILSGKIEAIGAEYPHMGALYIYLKNDVSIYFCTFTSLFFQIQVRASNNYGPDAETTSFFIPFIPGYLDARKAFYRYRRLAKKGVLQKNRAVLNHICDRLGMCQRRPDSPSALFDAKDVLGQSEKP